MGIIYQLHHSSLQTGRICLWMTRPPTKCCGFLTAAPRFVGERRRFVLSWTGQRDTSTLHRCVTPTCVCLFVCLCSVSSQVVCKEVIWNMRAYWEVEFSGWVVIGATYEGAGRRANSGPSGLGENEESWGLCWSGTQYEIWFNGVKKDINNVPFCSMIGVYLDQPAGIISFYAMMGEGAEREAQLLHRVETSMDQKILPGFWIGIQSSCTILKRPEWNVRVYQGSYTFICLIIIFMDSLVIKCITYILLSLLNFLNEFFEKYLLIVWSSIVDWSYFYKQKRKCNPEWFCGFSWGLLVLSGCSLHGKTVISLASLVLIKQTHFDMCETEIQRPLWAVTDGAVAPVGFTPKNMSFTGAKSRTAKQTCRFHAYTTSFNKCQVESQPQLICQHNDAFCWF